jgi:hypothetical protein
LHVLTFYLWNVPGLCLLIPAKSGVVYATQTGGHHCLQKSLEGLLLPLFNTYEGKDQEDLLRRHFVSKWHGWCGEQDGIDAATADFVDEVFRSTPYTDWLRTDRARLRESHEAWVYVEPITLHETETIVWGDFVFSNGVVTWPNSD